MIPEGEVKQYCSKKCHDAFKYIEDVKGCIEETENTSDKRIFFYDIGFGEVCDKYCIMMLRGHHQTKLAERTESDRELRKLWDCIKTKLNRSVYHPSTKKAIGELMDKLFRVNATMWRLRNIINGEALTERVSAAYVYHNLSILRDDFRAQLDSLVDGKVRIVRAYSS